MLIKLYTIKGCHNCLLVKQFFDTMDTVYTEVDCDKNLEEAIAIMRKAGSDTLPIIQFGEDNFILGYDRSNLEKLIKLV